MGGRPASRGRGNVVGGLGSGQRRVVGVELGLHEGQRVSVPRHPMPHTPTTTMSATRSNARARGEEDSPGLDADGGGSL